MAPRHVQFEHARTHLPILIFTRTTSEAKRLTWTPVTLPLTDIPSCCCTPPPRAPTVDNKTLASSFDVLLSPTFILLIRTAGSFTADRSVDSIQFPSCKSDWFYRTRACMVRNVPNHDGTVIYLSDVASGRKMHQKAKRRWAGRGSLSPSFRARLRNPESSKKFFFASICCCTVSAITRRRQA